MSRHNLEIADAAVRYIRCRRAKIDAKQARNAFMAVVHGTSNHQFQQCVNEERPLCEICKSSEPLHLEYRKAADATGAALRALSRLVE